MSKKWLIRIGLVGSIASIVGLAIAQPWRGTDPWWGWMPPSLQERLGLSEKQSKKITQLRARLSSRVGELVGKLNAKRSELRTLWLAPTPDKRRLQQVMRETLKLQQQLLSTRVEGMIDMIDVLTPEQLILLRDEGNWLHMCPMCTPAMGCPMHCWGMFMPAPMGMGQGRRGMRRGGHHCGKWW